MKKLLIILALPFLICCSKSPKQNESYNPHLLRIDSLITAQYENLSNELIRDYATNPAIAETAYHKCAHVHEYVKETEKILLADSILISNNVTINDFLLSLYPEFDKLKFDEAFIKPLKVKYFQYWIDKKLKNPLSKDDALSIIIDLKMFDCEVINYLHNGITNNDFNFNLLRPIVIEKSNNVKVGEVYEAKICFTAFDTTRGANISINNTSLELQNGYGVYRYQASKPGKKTFKGVIIFPRNNWEFVKLPFEHSINVY
jgi:hypothetical protein